MPHIITRHSPNHSTWIVPIVAGILIGCLLAVIANSVKDIRWASYNSRTDIVPALTDPKPAADRKPERYEAVRSNWQRYRSLQANE
jgi:hypothetical protein